MHRKNRIDLAPAAGRKKYKSATGLANDGVGEKDSQYFVEVLLDKRTVGKVVQYLVRWQAYPRQTD